MGKGSIAKAVCQHLRLAPRIVGGVHVAVDELARLLLAVQRQRQHGREVEKYALEIFRHAGDKISAGGGEVVRLEARGRDLRLPPLGVFGTDDVDGAVFAEGEVVAVAVV